MTLSALLVLDVHNRDVVNSMLSNYVNSIHDFEWIAQTRYYFTEKKKIEIEVKLHSLARARAA